MNPRAARSAASTPFSAARPAWSGFVIVPKPSRIPDDRLAVTASAISTCGRSSPASRAAVAAAPNAPIVAVVWNPSP